MSQSQQGHSRLLDFYVYQPDNDMLQSTGSQSATLKKTDNFQFFRGNHKKVWRHTVNAKGQCLFNLDIQKLHRKTGETYGNTTTCENQYARQREKHFLSQQLM